MKYSEEDFWKNIVRIGKKDSSAFKVLSALSDEELLNFQYHIQLFQDKLLDKEIWCIAYMAGEGTPDSFEMFRSWIISKGKNWVYKIMINPLEMLPLLKAEEIYSDEEISFMALNIYEDRTRKDANVILKRDLPKTNFDEDESDWRDELTEDFLKTNFKEVYDFLIIQKGKTLVFPERNPKKPKEKELNQSFDEIRERIKEIKSKALDRLNKKGIDLPSDSSLISKDLAEKMKEVLRIRNSDQ